MFSTARRETGGALSAYLDALADLFYPRWCVGCGRRARDVLCRGCVDGLPLVGRPFCGRCGMATAFQTFVCEWCKGTDFGFDSARAPLRYEGVGKELVHALKYRGYFPVVERVMAPLMAEVVEGAFDAVVPVPLHPARLRRRGFNQADLMARALARRLGIPVSYKLEAVQRTRDQVHLSGVGRRENVRGAFRPRGPVSGRVLLVDDVFTTGATSSACADALRRAGAREIHAMTLCKTL
jgi:ComF family protein